MTHSAHVLGSGNNKINISQSFVLMELNRKTVMNGYPQVNMQIRLRKRGEKLNHEAQEHWEGADSGPARVPGPLTLSVPPGPPFTDRPGGLAGVPWGFPSCTPRPAPAAE